MDSDSMNQLIAIVFFLLLSAFFSASETSLLSINKIRLKSMAEQKVKGAVNIEKIISRPDKLLATILVGNNAANVAISAIATSFVIAMFNNNSLAISLSSVVVTIIILVFSEITPKTLAAKSPERVSLFVSKPVGFLIVLFTPVVFVLNKFTSMIVNLFGSGEAQAVTLTETEIKTMVDVSHKEGVIETDERIMINNVFEFGDNTAKDIMTPRTDIVSVDVESGYDEIMEVFRNERYSRMLVYKEDIDNIVGILYFKDFIFCDIGNEDFNVERILRPAFFSYENKPISQLFSEMRLQSIPIAVILDEYSGTSGIVTIEDLVEEIVGDISDEDDEDDEDYELVREDEYLIDGSMKIDDFNEMAGTEFESPDYETMGGFALGLLGRIPEAGEEITNETIKIRIEEMDKNRIEKLRTIIIRPKADVDDHGRDE